MAARRATFVGIGGNIVLFMVKGAAGAASGSIALISDALNSLVDVAASIAISYSVAVAHREPDQDHPFGHQRAEPLAALAVAIFTAILGFSVGRAALEHLLEGASPIREVEWALGALLFSMAGNLLLARYLRRRGEALDSPAILANAIESENDIWASLAALIGVGAAALGLSVLDPLAGILVGGWIILGGYRFGRQNIDYLMGKSPRAELLGEIRGAALEVAGVKGVHDVRGHHVGHRVHVEVHIEVDEDLRTRQSHDLAGTVRRAIERIPVIDRAFVHVDPVLDSMLVIETLARSERLVSETYAELARQRVGGPPFEALWTALATRAQARAEQLAVVRRLKGAGWHFDDAELSAERVRRRWEGLMESAVQARQRPLPLEAALAIALELEGGSDRADFAVAATPWDSALADSLVSESPPPPSMEILVRRIAAARESVQDSDIARRLEDLRERLVGGG
ncbi:MAG TPA: cation diffusion facilitator family transporter [Gemmatimonadota bacterium]|nr:cation diffusion facilitator family transporter [Gemmatimonadota bacterium]